MLGLAATGDGHPSWTGGGGGDVLASRVSKTGATVQNRNSSTKNDFCIFGFRNIKYKKPDLVYRTGPETEKNSETDGSRPVFETLVAHSLPRPFIGGVAPFGGLHRFAQNGEAKKEVASPCY